MIVYKAIIFLIGLVSRGDIEPSDTICLALLIHVTSFFSKNCTPIYYPVTA